MPTQKARLSLCALVLTLTWTALAGEGPVCSVIHCHDGDTCTLACGARPDVWSVRVRLHCIDAPEIAQRPWGQASRDTLRKWLPPGALVHLEIVDRDRHGRAVGVLRQGRYDINLAMVAGGWAAVYPEYCDRQEYYAAEREARAARRGVWRVPGMHQRPWEWRKGG